ncbi:MAG: hypothetical protein ACKOI2_08785 [Actinomycetota bacterium]
MSDSSSRRGERLVFATAKPFAPANAHVVVHPAAAEYPAAEYPAAEYMDDIDAGT